jgi:signal transduction histidine kinase
METFKRLTNYWGKFFKETREAYAMTSAIIAVICAILLFVGRLANANPGALQLLSHPITEWVLIIVPVFLVLRLLLWLPVVRHEQEQAKFNEALATKQKEIDDLKLEIARLRGEVVIHSAEYGAGDYCADVSDFLRGEIANGRRKFPVTNGLLNGRPDPCPNTPKTLKVEYSTRAPRTRIIPERHDRPEMLIFD